MFETLESQIERLEKAGSTDRFCMTCARKVEGPALWANEGYSICCNDRITDKRELLPLLRRDLEHDRLEDQIREAAKAKGIEVRSANPIIWLMEDEGLTVEKAVAKFYARKGQ
jgi:hypothetical protein